jgi:predicted ATPase/DNA-binding winged helix-turn-helix (wHTH) protein
MLYVFGDYTLDTQRREVQCAGQPVHVRAKVFQVLVYLLTHRDRVVPKQELCEQLWPTQFISDATLDSCIAEARRAVGDSGRAQRVIRTRHGYGYRFVGIVQAEGVRLPAPETALSGERAPMPSPEGPKMLGAVGREVELEHLRRCFDKALTGVRQVVFVTGEAGLGKTTVVEAFLAQVGDREAFRIGRGQCIEHYGVGEAYLPVLESLGRLCQAAGGAELTALLARRAPTWLVQMPWLLSPADLQTLQRQVVGATRERMLREMAEALEALTTSQPLILVLEDLHWSDYSTLDLLAMLARRQEPARLLLLGTYRPAEVARREHPVHAVQQELHVHGWCTDLPLTFLTATAIAKYLETRFPETQLPTELMHFVHQRTEGNPLFMVNMVEYWVTQGWLAEVEGCWMLRVGLPELQAGMPATLRQMLETQLGRLRPEEQRVLEAGSVAGGAFSAAAVAAGLDDDVIRIDEQCAAVARRSQWLRTCGEQSWPDGTVAGGYSFVHALHQEVLYSRLTAARRVSLHQQIGMPVEAGYGPRAREIAAELAMHFAQGRETRRAVTYLRQAAHTALRRYANREAIDHLTQGLALLTMLPETPERTQQELDLLLTLGPVWMAIKGQGAPEVERVYTRARALCQQVGETPDLFPVLWGLWRFYLVRTEYQTARELAEQCLSLAQRVHDPVLLLVAHYALGATLYFLGAFTLCRAHLEQGLALYNRQQHQHLVFRYGMDLGVWCLAYLIWPLWKLGYPDQALQRANEAITLAQQLAHPLSLASALDYAAMVHYYRREVHATQERAEASMALASEKGIPQFLALGMILRGWALAVQGQGEEGIAQLHQGLTAFRAAGAEIARSRYLALLAEAYGKVGQTEAGLTMLAEALAMVGTTGERFEEAELHRLKGELLLVLSTDNTTEAEACFHQALDIARRQEAKSLELRAATSLSRLWQAHGKHAAARQMLAEIYGWFTEGFDTADLQEAKALLDELS